MDERGSGRLVYFSVMIVEDGVLVVIEVCCGGIGIVRGE